MKQSLFPIITNASVYPHPVLHLSIKETHISWIVLTGRYAYKIKKSVKFGNVLDFSNLSLRRKYCKKEVTLNRQLCGNMYKGVVKLVLKNGKFRFVNLSDKSKPLEYAVKMKEFPQECRMDYLLKSKKITKNIISKFTGKLVRFHNSAQTSTKIKRLGRPESILSKIDENFRTIEKINKIPSYYESQLKKFLRDNQGLFLRRLDDCKIRDIHGDLYLANIFVDHLKFYMYDRLEFNDELRFADVLEDVAHFAMDLDFHKRDDLSKFFLSTYRKKSQDVDMFPFVYFWMCYKACMRSKVSFFRAKNSDGAVAKNALADAHSLLELASSYMNRF